jgi:hypothetical protein
MNGRASPDSFLTLRMHFRCQIRLIKCSDVALTLDATSLLTRSSHLWTGKRWHPSHLQLIHSTMASGLKCRQLGMSFQ